MWIDKLYDGVLRVKTPAGQRFLQPKFAQRVYFMWMFRHFDHLPVEVLSTWQQKLVDGLFLENRFAAVPPGGTLDEIPVLGTVERRPPEQVQAPPKRPDGQAKSATAGAGLVSGLQQRS